MKTFILYVIFGVSCVAVYDFSHNEKFREELSDIIAP